MAAATELLEPTPGTHSRTVEPRQTTLGKHGAVTIVGQRALVFEPMDIAFRVKLGRIVAADPTLEEHIGRKTMVYLAHSLRRLGDEDLTELGTTQRMLKVNSLRLADIMYLGLLRLAQMDEGRIDLGGGDPCPFCHAKLPGTIQANLLELPLFVWDEEPRATYRFRRPPTIAGQVIETVTMEPPSVLRAVAPMTRIDFTVGVLREMRWLSAAICEINGKPQRLMAEQLISRGPDGRGIDMDWGGLVETLGDVTAGPGGALPYKHRCGETLPLGVGWSTGFFGPSED